ncbi:deoxyribodipyrimidine photo-lyase [Undibacterium sp. TS12]|uniref:cryptochrome/photolyase family protein n=1 Tax=Undibacterium sp. TS12 TaxID=2908202 RepID=UPI001F4D1BB3|nr:deoxyribodipyrimidine photo-lyase [Undibacterium sp. TS12]MCH8620140.1 DNA photolyase family protein [Undibacterium sp. TS12]
MQENKAPFQRSLVWFRRDLRNFDHAALHHALRQSTQVFCVFIFDKTIVDNLPENDRRIAFIHESIVELSRELKRMGGGLRVLHAHAEQEIPRLAAELEIDALFTNHDYEPQANARDLYVQKELLKQNCAFFSFKDQVIFEKSEILSLAGTPFSVFTPYKNAWLKKFHADGDDFYSSTYPIEKYAHRLAAVKEHAIPSLADLGFQAASARRMPVAAGMSGGRELFDDFVHRMKHYDQSRDFPAVKGPSYLSVHLRFGTVSIRHLVREAIQQIRTGTSRGAKVWLSELIWRDFYFMILHHHPHVACHSFKPGYDAIPWETGQEADAHFAAWCEGRTGYPLVDAAMLQLNQTGYMHNRLRMITACFLIKDLGIDWRRGEAYFAEHLNDFDLSANNGGWQWASSSGCDAQPYFRIFNPITQSEKFDPEGKFIKRYLPQLSTLDKRSIHAPWKAAPLLLEQAGIKLGKDYPFPLVDHDVARKQTLTRYAVVKKMVTHGEED